MNREPIMVQQDVGVKLRIIVNGDGFYEVTQNEWEQNGLTIQNLDQIHFEYQGAPYPFWINQNPDDKLVSIRFYSPKIPENINLNQNVFILSERSTDSSTVIVPLTIQPEQDDIKKNSTGVFREFYQNQSIYLPQLTGEDHWLWALLQPDKRVDQEIYFFQLPEEDITLRCQFWVTPTNVMNTIQLLKATINGHDLDIIQVKEQDWHQIELQIDASYLSKLNTFSIQSVSANENPTAKVYLDWIEIEYSIPLGLGPRFQSFSISESLNFFSTVSESGTLIVIDNDGKPLTIYSLQSEGQIKIKNLPGTKYAWVPDDEFSPVLIMQPVQDEITNIPENSIDYLFIAPKIFQQALMPLIALRNEQGLNTYLVSPQQIYDALNSGYPSPDSIQKFIQHVYEVNTNKLKYLLLVGDYSYENVTYQDFINYVPSFFVNDGQMGQTISDFPYVNLNADSQVELAVGRVPAQAQEQVSVWVEKVLNYERAIPKKWNNIFAISDPSDSIFVESARLFLHELSDENHTHIYNPPDLDEIQEIFMESYSLVTYFGHGSIDLWGKDRILSPSMISELPESSAPSVIISFSCLNGYFIHPDKLSLAEGILFHPGGGAIGILAPNGQPILENQENLVQFFQNKLQSIEYSRINELIFPQEGETIHGDTSFIELLNTYIFFGDPAMSIPNVHN